MRRLVRSLTHIAKKRSQKSIKHFAVHRLTELVFAYASTQTPRVGVRILERLTNAIFNSNLKDSLP
jgi:hypothetical protein